MKWTVSVSVRRMLAALAGVVLVCAYLFADQAVLSAASEAAARSYVYWPVVLAGAGMSLLSALAGRLLLAWHRRKERGNVPQQFELDLAAFVAFVVLAVFGVSTWLCGSPVALRGPYLIALWFSLLCCVCRNPRPQPFGAGEQPAPAQDADFPAAPEEQQGPQGSSGPEEGTS